MKVLFIVCLCQQSYKMFKTIYNIPLSFQSFVFWLKSLLSQSVIHTVSFAISFCASLQPPYLPTDHTQNRPNPQLSH